MNEKQHTAEPEAKAALVLNPTEKISSEAPSPSPATRSLSWEALSQGERHLLIQYNGQEYHLRETRNGKLILTK